MSPAASVLARMWCFFRWQSEALVKSEIKGLMLLTVLEEMGSIMGAIVAEFETDK